jgi:asparagine synthetase B (glutamine-hydrolysing)
MDAVASTPARPESLADLLAEHIARKVPARDVALTFSGGIDSLSIGFAAQRAGKRVHAYTFFLQGTTNTDIEAARYAAARFGWQFDAVPLPTDIEVLQRDFARLHRDWHCRLKTQYECVWPMLYLAPRITEHAVLSALGTDGYFGLSRKALVRWKVRDDPDAFVRFREDFFANPNVGSRAMWSAVLAQHGKEHVVPYIDDAVKGLLLQQDWRTINGGGQFEKVAIIRAFPDEFSRVPIRKHANFQLVAGIPAHFERLLSTPLNVHHRTRIIDLCRDYASV